MKIEELTQACKKAAKSGGLILVLPPSRRGQGNSIHLLTERRGPRGRVLNVNSKGETVALFDPNKILKYIESTNNGD